MGVREDLDELWNIIANIRKDADHLIKYKSNAFYKKQYLQLTKDLNKKFAFMEARINRSSNKSLKSKFLRVKKGVNLILSNSSYAEKIAEVDALEMFWPELEIEFENLKLGAQIFEIPAEIPMTEYRFDLEEAIKDYDNGCFVSSLVLCRRAYEGALAESYKNLEKKEPKEDVRCPNCKAVIRTNSYMGISKLHNWAIKKGIVTERLKDVGFLVTEMGAGAAHPPLVDFPRDPELAKLGITATIALLKEMASNLQK
ncbi:MAG: hypothetical protein JRM94_04745 [Nitrososphaerota archaeon]|nr:hypothetical protein [Nitrososphaerota archaeon]